MKYFFVLKIFITKIGCLYTRKTETKIEKELLMGKNSPIEKEASKENERDEYKFFQYIKSFFLSNNTKQN